MKTFILTLICLTLALVAHAQAGSSCANPRILTVNDSVCSFTQITAREVSTGFDSIPPAFYNNRKIKPKIRYWFKFTATSKNSAISVRELEDFTVVVYSGTCGALTQIMAYSCYLPDNYYLGQTIYTETFVGAVENLQVGSDYYIMVSSDINPFNQPVAACVSKLPDNGKRIVSTPQGGPWSAKSSWIGGKIPTPIDTAVIADGSTIFVTEQLGKFGVRQIEIGEGAPEIARLKFQNYNNQFIIYQDLIIHSGDSLVGLKNSLGGDRFAVFGDIHIDGVFSYFTLQYPYLFRHFLSLRGNTHQRVFGTGSFLGIGIPVLLIDNPNGVDWTIGGYMKSHIYLKRGVFNNTQSTFDFFSDTLNGIDGRYAGFSVGNGRMTRKLSTVNTKTNGFKSNMLYFAEFKDDPHYPNSDIMMDDHYPPGVRFLNMELAKSGGRKVIFNRSTGIRILDLLGGGIVQANPSDTLTNYSCHFDKSTANTHVEFGTYRNIYQTTGIGTWAVPAWAGGKARSFAFLDYLANAPAGNVIQVRIKTTPPGGAVVAPATFMMGPHVVEVTSNTALAAATKLRLEVYDTDSLVGLKNSWRIAQAPTPNGPWTPLAVTHTFVADNDPVLDAIMTTTNPISLTNGNYFAFASVGNPTDAVLSRVIPVPTFGFGCGPGHSTTVKMLVNNNGLTPLTEVMAGALVNGSLYFQNYAVGSNWPAALAVGATDTLRFSIPGDAAVNGLVKFFVSASGEGNRSNDTLKIRLNTLPTPLPVTINFDTCKYLGISALGLFKFGHPIVAGWENAPNGTPQNGGTWGNAFVSIPTAPFPSTNRFHLTAPLYLPFGSTHFRSANFGPIGNSSWLTYKFNIIDNEFSNEMRTTDTLIMEASNNCGQSYVPLRIINRSNFTQYLDPGALLITNGNLPPPSTWWDSLPFPAGSIVHFRFRLKAFQPLSNYGQIVLNDVRFVDTLFTGVRPDLEQANQWQIYPNPASDEVFFTLPKGEQLKSLRLFDALGRRYTLGIPPPNQPASLKGISPGVYILEAQTEGKRYRQRLVVH